MRKSLAAVLLISIVLISSIGFTSTSAEILNPKIVHAIVSNLASIYGKTYHLQVGSKISDIYYGFNITYANVTNILLIPDHNSMQISLKEVTESDAMWIQFPQDLISAENNKFVLYVDGKEKKYELATSAHSTVMGFMVPMNATLVEIQGTRVVPEFPMYPTAALMVSFIAMMLFSNKIMKR
jgi:hypothetical protein